MSNLFIDQGYNIPPADVSDIETKWLDVPYMDGDRHRLDIYLPNGATGAVPVIIDLYGGGLYRGEKSSEKMHPALNLLRDYGYAVVSPDYSRLQEAPFPTQIYEVKAAIRFLRAHADEYQLDMQRVALMGESSGSQLAVTTAVTATSHAMEDHTFGDFPTEAETVNAVIAMYGPYEFDQFPQQFAASGVTPKFAETGTAISFEGQLFQGQAPKDVPELVHEVNPVTYFSGNMPPMLGFAGTSDPVVPYQQTQNLFEAAQAFLPADQVPYVLVPGAVHGIKDYMGPAMTQQKADFLARWIGKGQNV